MAVVAAPPRHFVFYARYIQTMAHWIFHICAASRRRTSRRMAAAEQREVVEQRTYIF